MDRAVRISRLKKWCCFGILYFICFGMIEARCTDFHVIHAALDEKIPFCKYFVIPYLLWFPYVGATILYFSMFNAAQRENDDFFAYMLWGSVIFVTVSVIYPNMHRLRPACLGDDLLSRLVAMIYRADTPTNILPSLHVYNSIACLTALMKNAGFKQHRRLCAGANILTFLIILSTVFLKQHSTVDVVMAFCCNAAVHHIVYRMPESDYRAKKRQWHSRVQGI